MVIITCDTDWAPEEVILDTLNLLSQYHVKCTFFATNESKVLKQAQTSLFEIGIHPNFNLFFEGKVGSAKSIVSDLLAIYPQATGVRAHSLTTSSKLIEIYHSLKLTYESSLFIPYEQSLKCFSHINGMLGIPFCWEDDYHFIKNNSFENLGIDLDGQNTIIMNFHPIHIYLNTISQDHYLKAKKYYGQPKELLKLRHRGQKKGVRDAFISVLKHIGKAETTTLSELIDL